jgi:tRNA A37 threonylcarbamoyladenosine synthetase subunit TsaC/SUA5/YrdC
MLKKDEIFITTTDTLIGIGSKINNENLDALYKLKKRPLDKKIVIVISSLDQLKKMEELNDQSMEYISQY